MGEDKIFQELHKLRDLVIFGFSKVGLDFNGNKNNGLFQSIDDLEHLIKEDRIKHQEDFKTIYSEIEMIKKSLEGNVTTATVKELFHNIKVFIVSVGSILTAIMVFFKFFKLF